MNVPQALVITHAQDDREAINLKADLPCVTALWHMAWWIGTLLLAMAALSAGLVLVVFAHAQPPESA